MWRTFWIQTFNLWRIPPPIQTPRELQKWANSRRSARKTISHVVDTSLTPCLIDCMISTCRYNLRWKYGKLLKRNTTLSNKELLQVGAIISKFPLFWDNYWKKLLHIAGDFIMEKILRHLHIEEETWKRDMVYLPQISKVIILFKTST
ncbi:hypothetical protein ES288_D03G151300v1 [Gossypium darwinii]|uniref:Uncharacterized protein n=1 Tax=Gossypium darwinii TaxID=34276 RepID=A0A5D2D7E5_GOSDA|nr:hypothetical protein ES288_D03G151300v1 [Gossypium darwinii]